MSGPHFQRFDEGHEPEGMDDDGDNGRLIGWLIYGVIGVTLLFGSIASIFEALRY